MDGAMPKTVLIILAAVVALIVIVVLTGMRYLRADDEDDFDDDVPAEHGSSRSRGSHPRADRTRSRHSDDLAKRQTTEIGAGPAQVFRGRDERGAGRAILRAQSPARNGSARLSRRGGDRSWREDRFPPAVEAHAAVARDQRPARRSARPRRHRRAAHEVVGYYWPRGREVTRQPAQSAVVSGIRLQTPRIAAPAGPVRQPGRLKGGWLR
jgi:hypothetical protein